MLKGAAPGKRPRGSKAMPPPPKRVKGKTSMRKPKPGAKGMGRRGQGY